MTHGPKLIQIEPILFDRVWPHCEDMMRRGLTVAPELLSDKTRGRIADGTLQVWIVVEADRLLAALFTDIRVNDDDSTWLCVHALGGRQLWRWVRVLHEGLLAFARKEGCASVRFAGKRGWGRLLRDCRVVGESRPGEPIYERHVQ